MPALLVLLVVAAGAFPAAPQAKPRPSSAEQYRAIVEQYRAGEGKEAVRQLLGMDRGEVAKNVERAALPSGSVVGYIPVDAVFLRAAAMLHAEAAFECWIAGRVGEGATQLEFGRVLIDATARPGTTADQFRRAWYLSTSLIASAFVVAEEAMQHFDRALKRLPTDAALLTAAGWFAERQATRAADERAGPDEYRAWSTRFRVAAEGYLTRAVDAAPADPAAALRLARVHVLAGDDRQARERLAGLLKRTDLEPSVGYVARLLLGGIHERAGDTAAAESVYREAIGLDVRAQSARLALGALLYARGDAIAAADLVARVVDLSRTRSDPWSNYQLTFVPLGKVVFEDLRKQVQR